MKRTVAAKAAALLCGLTLAACGSSSGGDTGGGGTGGGNNNGTGVIGSAGGTVSLPSGPTIVVPAGALPSSTTISVAASSIAAPAGAVSKVFQFGPEGTTFSTPVTVSFEVPVGTKGSDVAVYWTKPGSTTQWDVLPATVSGTVATASVTHFSAGFVGAACAAGAACTPTNACHTGTTTCNGTPTCADTGTNVTDGAACGGGNVCTAGVCGSPLCVPNVSCTPPGTPDACKTYATSCDASGIQTCGATGNTPDGTTCGSGLVCTAGTCGPAAACNTIVNSASPIHQVDVPQNLPSPTGGAIVDGTYELTSSERYVGPGGSGGTSTDAFRATLVVSNGTGQRVMGFVGGAESRQNFTFAVSGTQVTSTFTCGGTEAEVSGFTATPTRIQFITPSAPGSSDQGIVSTLTLKGSTGSLTLSGTVTGPWVEGVTVTLGGAGPGSVTTDSAGRYSFAGLAAGNYTVTPSLEGYAYSPVAPQVALSASVTGVNFTATPVLPSYSVSGTVNYSGIKTGRTYVMAKCISVSGCVVSHHPGHAGSPTAATSIATAGGAYVIRGLSPGTYSLTAAIDTQGTGFFHGSDPSGSTSFTIGAGDLSGVNVPITDPVIAPPVIPAITQVIPFDGGALVRYSGRHTGSQASTSYRLSWGTDAAASNGTPVVFPVGQEEDMSQFLHAGLTNGQALYYKLSAINTAGESAPSPVMGPYTIGSTGGGSSTVSGTLTLPVPATGPLFVGLWDFSTSTIYGEAIPASASLGVPFSFNGVPDGSYLFFPWIDMNRNGVMDLGDVGVFLGNCGDPLAMTFSTVSGNTRIDASLNTIEATATVLTQHYRSSAGSPDTYTMTAHVQGLYKLPVAATLFSGPRVRVPLDMATNQMNLQVQCAWAGYSLNGTRPSVGDTYRHRLTFSDGTTKNIAAGVSAVLDAFAQNLGQTTTAPYSRTQPLLTWSAPASPPASYSYAVSISGPGNSWYYYGPRGADGPRRIPSTTTSVPFNVDGGAQQASLTPGVTYTYEVEVVDGSGNSALYRTTYTP